MKTQMLLLGFLLGFLLLSCGNDDDASTNDIIIGKWRTIEKYESGVQVDLEVCEPHFYTEYKADNSIIGDRIITEVFPDECGLLINELGWNWSNLGNNQYRIRYLEEVGQVLTIYKEGANLVIESPDGIVKTVREPYLD